ncbi:penicillin-binding protein 1C [Gemmobacter nectariphilus]|uniref:penicillin-binding protein 1C n=1 Tax=Gemmobacter nectariphilus TaxID=220343 RepID=UPI00041A6636|nr:penicillin-binding protein 1C [Gemmobacter nectariphilus]
MIARAAFALAAGLWLAAAARDGAEAWIDATTLPPLTIETGAEVVARDGRLLRAWTVADGRWRLAADSTQVDPLFLSMLIAYEDRRFATHFGVDARAMVRAVAQAVWNGRVVSGGSTLTMQVARLLEESGTGKLSGKLRQMRVALALERRLTKPQILNLYLRLAPYGGNLEGLRAASLSWFGREPARLTPAQAALLVALPQSPQARRPDRGARAAADGRSRVLDRALSAGLISAETAAAARTEPLPSARRDFPRLAPHLTDRLRLADPARLHIATTLDASLQERLEGLATEAVARQGERLQVAMIVADHTSGELLASVGSAAYENDAREGFVDMTQALRSPGSTLKPLVYALAFDQGLAHPETLIEDRPVAFGRYQPQNFDRQFRGTVRVREALQLSLNIPVVTLTEAIGPERLMQGLRRAGVRAVLPGDGPPGLAVSLGGLGVTLEDLTGLYAALARGGVARPLSPLPDGRSEGERLVSQVAAWQVGNILAGLQPPDGSAPGRIAWKTGTSYGHRDAWAVGWDGRHVAGVWMGRADGTPVPGAFGGDLAAPILFAALARIQPQPLPPPPAATLQVENARLPLPLQRFRPRGTIAAPGSLPEIAFPPDGAEVALDGAPLLARVRGGTPPFTWMADGQPLDIATTTRESHLPLPHLGPLTLSVIDANGQAARVTLTLAP